MKQIVSRALTEWKARPVFARYRVNPKVCASIAPRATHETADSFFNNLFRKFGPNMTIFNHKSSGIRP